MNEFVDESSGVLIGASARGTNGRVMMGDGTEWDVEPSAICAGMDQVLAMTPYARQKMAQEGQRKYFDQLGYFQSQMNDLRDWLRQ
ncbi:hypothetical protein DYB37_014102 [Aphanomyces astaci]|uniref:Uncharacterized protein n=1 Tax=Aphanomyces astaci TaxID=112090 RepID=A0A3R7BZQ5_APHAT|nr:hypothetical protein DYB35_013600 [Aphanomyces astaci]RHZ09343.1 hypothetical protein DYB37_014102 [Aphanomyces astaci]